jgi:hypothetical protein
MTMSKTFNVGFSRLFFVLSRFRVFFSDGSSKTPQKMFCKKSMSKKNPQKSTKISMSGSPRFFVLSRFRVFFSDGSSKTLNKKNVLQKARVEKFLQKSRQKIQNRFFLDFGCHVFGRFSVRGVQKHRLKRISKIKSDTGPFFASDPPNHQGAADFFGRLLGPRPCPCVGL